VDEFASYWPLNNTETIKNGVISRIWADSLTGMELAQRPKDRKIAIDFPGQFSEDPVHYGKLCSQGVALE
jgi:hypothetical protein